MSTPYGHSAQVTGDETATPPPVLTVRDLHVSTRGPAPVELLHGVDLAVPAGRRVGLIGESGSGKSLTALAVMGLLASSLRATGSIRVAGLDADVIGADESTLSRARGRVMSMVFQEPMTALNPTMRIVDQVAEVMTIHDTVPSRRAARERVLELLASVHLPDPPRIARSYPHQLSGGQVQRVGLAMALANDPILLVADEPTTALDVTVQARMLDLIADSVESRGAALLFITHDLGVVASVCEDVVVMYGGRIVEAGPVQQVLVTPHHRYTQGLVAASDLAVDATGHLRAIAGSVPSPAKLPPGCPFADRCWKATALCATPPPWTGVAHGPGFACHHPANPDEVPR